MRNIVGYWTGGSDYQTTDALVNLGQNGTLDGFDITDYSNRTAQALGCSLSVGWRVRNGTLRLDAPTGTAKVLFGADRGGHLIDGLTFDIKGTLDANLFRVLSCSDVTVRNVLVKNPAGRTSVYTVQVESGVTRTLIAGINDLNGSDLYSGGTYADCAIRDASWRSPASGRSTTATSAVALSANDQERTVTFSRSGDQSCTVSDATSWGVGVSTRLYKSGSGTLTVTATGGATLRVDPAITVPLALYSRVVVTKLDATTFLLHR